MTWRAGLAAVIESYCGLRLRPEDATGKLGALVRERAAGLGHADVLSYVAWLQRAGDRDELTRLVAAITVPQTSFFRDERQLRAIASQWRNERDRAFQIWSAGCATGEEVYSLAIMAVELGIVARVLGTDINAGYLGTARDGRYPRQAIATLAPHRAARFTERGGDVALRPELTALVDFRTHNLAADPLPRPDDGRGWNLVVCRNVLIYFDRQRAVEVVRRLASAVEDGGWLVLGAADPFVAGQVATLRPVCVDGQWLHQKWPALATKATGEGTTDRGAALADTLETGNRSLAMHDFAGARAAYQRCLRLAPHDAEAAYLLGLLHRKEGDPAAAAHWFRRALRLAPHHWPARYLLGSCLERAGRADDAGAEFVRVLEQLEAGRDVDVLRSRLSDLPGLQLSPRQVASACRAWLRERSVRAPH